MDDTKFRKNESALCFKGGPGGSGSGFGNFEEIGPLNRNLEPRKTNWVRMILLLHSTKITRVCVLKMQCLL